MFFVVNLLDAEKKIIVPSKWVLNCREQNVWNYGINATKKYLIYFSSNMNNDPNFALPIRRGYEFRICAAQNEDACFNGTIVRAFSK